MNCDNGTNKARLLKFLQQKRSCQMRCSSGRSGRSHGGHWPARQACAARGAAAAGTDRCCCALQVKLLAGLPNKSDEDKEVFESFAEELTQQYPDHLALRVELLKKAGADLTKPSADAAKADLDAIVSAADEVCSCGAGVVAVAHGRLAALFSFTLSLGEDGLGLTFVLQCQHQLWQQGGRGDGLHKAQSAHHAWSVWL